jgi:hypothetical protein
LLTLVIIGFVPVKISGTTSYSNSPSYNTILYNFAVTLCIHSQEPRSIVILINIAAIKQNVTLCRWLFLIIKYIKSVLRNHFSNEINAVCVALKIAY